MKFFLISLIAFVTAQHDHADHIDEDFILAEAMKCGKMPWANMMHELDERKTDMAKLKNKWKIDVERRSKGEEGYWDLWVKNYAQTYQKMSDRFLIAQHVCEQIWEGSNDCKHHDPWEDKYDGRGEAFRKEFIAEIHRLVADKITEIKTDRKSRGEL